MNDRCKILPKADTQIMIYFYLDPIPTATSDLESADVVVAAAALQNYKSILLISTI